MSKYQEAAIFVKHLRLNYQLLILSGPFLLGVLLSGMHNSLFFLIQYINIHVFLYGGVTAYNSYWDKDKGPIGGLFKPPRMKTWMLYGSWALQIISLLISSLINIESAIITLFSILLFWLYSSPTTRWKTKPIRALLLMAVGMGVAVLLGVYSSKIVPLNTSIIFAMIAAALLIISTYPFSQVYQIAQDRAKGDTTFCVVYGVKGVQWLFFTAFPLGIILLTIAIRKLLGTLLPYYAILIIGVIIGMSITISKIRGRVTEYQKVMITKYISGIAFSAICILLMFIN